MENSTYIQLYILIYIICAILTIGIMLILNKGLKKLIKQLSHDPEIETFFIRLINVIILLAGLGTALKSCIKVAKESNWLTLTWDAAEQLSTTAAQLLETLMTLAIIFFILHLIQRKINL